MLRFFRLVLILFVGMCYLGNSNILSQHLQNLNLHQAPLVNVPKNQGKIFLFHFRLFKSTSSTFS